MGLDIVCTAHTPRAQFGDEEMKAGRRMRNRDSDRMGKRQVGRAYEREIVKKHRCWRLKNCATVRLAINLLIYT